MVIIFVHFTTQKTLFNRCSVAFVCTWQKRWHWFRHEVIAKRCEYGQYISRSMPRISPSVILCVRESNYEIGKKYVLSSRKKIIWRANRKMVKFVLLSWKMRKKIIIRNGSLYFTCSYAICIPTHRKEKYFLPNSHTKRKVLFTEAERDMREGECRWDNARRCVLTTASTRGVPAYRYHHRTAIIEFSLLTAIHWFFFPTQKHTKKIDAFFFRWARRMGGQYCRPVFDSFPILPSPNLEFHISHLYRCMGGDRIHCPLGNEFYSTP